MSLYLYLVFVSHAGENEYEQLNRQKLLDSNNADEEEVSGFNHKSFCLEIIQGGTADDTTDHSGKAYPCDKFPPQQPVSFEAQTATTTTTTTTAKQEVFWGLTYKQHIHDTLREAIL